MKKVIKYFPVTIYLALLLAYTLYDYLNSGNSGFDDSNRGGVYLFLILLVGYSFIYLFFHRPIHLFAQPFTRLMLLLTVWLIICNLVNGRLGWIMYVHLFLSIWWFFSYLFINTYCSINPGAVDYIIDAFSMLLLLYLYFAIVSQSRILDIRETEYVVMNYAYNILAFIPIVLLLKNKTIKYILLGIAIVAIFLSYKRGPLVILPFMYLLYQHGLPNSKKNFIKQLLGLLIAVVLFILVYYIVDTASGGFLSSRFAKSELQYGSSRDELWSTAISDIASRDFFTLLIGKGSGSSIDLLTSGVHNEWLEFLFSFGIIGVTLYFLFGVSLIKKFVKMKKLKSDYAPIMGMLIAFFWIVGLFSGFYFVHASFYFFALLGIIDALDRRKKSIPIL